MMRLEELRQRGLGESIWGDPNVVIKGVRHDSRHVEPGDLFVAIAGESTDGTRFVSQALDRGAVAIASPSRLPVDAPQLEVPEPRRSLGALAAAVYGDPTARLDVIGLTGTNGKTTTTWIIHEALLFFGANPALLGTIKSCGPGVDEASAYTTPEGDAIARFAQSMVEAGAEQLVMEVSSHALAQHRADAVHFAVAAFTNLTQDHLDFHASMDEYFEAKARLFLDLAPRSAVINVDDLHGQKLAERVTVPSLLRVSRERDAEVRVIDAELGRDGIVARLMVQGVEVRITSKMIGSHNLDNLALALGCLVALGYEAAEAASAVSSCSGVPGRLERVEGLEDVLVVVDYAHTPDALANALDAVSAITPGRCIVVFGCGGDRDADKRPKMGDAAASRADLAFITSDNPRSEDPFSILAAIEPAVDKHLPRLAPDDALNGRGYLVVEDRRTAIARAIGAAGPGDSVLIAGKGHEDYQIRGAERLHFDDREEARAAIASGGGS